MLSQEQAEESLQKQHTQRESIDVYLGRSARPEPGPTLTWPSPCRACPGPISQQVVPGQPTGCIFGPSMSPLAHWAHFGPGQTEKHGASVVPVLSAARSLQASTPAAAIVNTGRACTSRCRRAHQPPPSPTLPANATAPTDLRQLPTPTDRRTSAPLPTT